MPVNPDAVGARSEPSRRSWDSKDCLLYALGVGAGADDPSSELEFTTENSQNVTQRVLPTAAVVLNVVGGGLDKVGSFNPVMLVHGEQGITLDREIPVEGELESVSEVVGIWDKGSGALVQTETVATLVSDGRPLFTTRAGLFLRGEGGWGGERGPSSTFEAPDKPADHEVVYPTRVDQPILHGLCTYGFTGRALLHTLAGGDPARFRSMNGRFSSPVFPGEALTVRVWRGPDEGSAVFQTFGADGRVVLDAGQVTFDPS
jgi:hypothetical protein